MSRGVLAWPVDIEPSWPVFMAWSMSSASALTALPDHDPVGAHAQGVAHQLADRDGALALDVRRARLERDHVLLAELELGGVLDGDDPLVIGDERGEDVEHGRLAGAGAARRRRC